MHFADQQKCGGSHARRLLILETQCRNGSRILRTPATRTQPTPASFFIDIGDGREPSQTCKLTRSEIENKRTAPVCRDPVVSGSRSRVRRPLDVSPSPNVAKRLFASSCRHRYAGPRVFRVFHFAQIHRTMLSIPADASARSCLGCPWPRPRQCGALPAETLPQSVRLHSWSQRHE